MSTMPKYVAKTYGRRAQKDNSSRAFDDIFTEGNGKNGRPSTAMATGTMQRWGKASYTSSRSNIQTGNAPSPEPVKRKAEEEVSLFDDPFSFDSEEDSPSKEKKMAKICQVPVPSSSSKPVLSSSSNPVMSSFNNKVQYTVEPNSSRTEEDSLLKKPPARTYSRAPRGGGKSGKASVAPLLDTSKPTTSLSTQNTLSIDLFSKKVPAVSLEKDSSQESSPGARNCHMVRKFFTSRLSDHNYSSQTSSSQDSPATGDKLQEAKLFDSDGSDFEFDSDQELDSGDPEIIFNSPKKRAQRAARLMEGVGGSDSPITVSSEASEASTVKDFSIVPDEDASKAVRLTKSQSDTSSNCKSILTYSRASRVSTDSNNSVASSNASNSTNNNRTSDGFSSFNKERCVATYSRKLLSAKLETEKKKDKKEAPVVRRLLSSSPRKSPIKAVYNPRQWVDDGAGKEAEKKPAKSGLGLFDDFDELDEEPAVKEKPTMKRTVTWPTRIGDEAISSLKVSKQHKELFTVVRNVKQAHECQEHGETQEFDDDIEYIMDGLGPSQNVGIRCLSTASLVTKCAMPGFRMHLRAHGTVAKIFSALQDSPKYPTLALCTAAVLFMMSRDRLNMDMERSTLELMLELLSVSGQNETQTLSRTEAREFDKLRKKIQEACQEVQKNGSTKQFELENISTGHLAMESLLTLTSKRAGDWFKEELRTLGGLDHIIDSVADCIDDLDEIIIEPTDSTLDRLLRVDRCLRVLENVTFLNSDNQNYLIAYKSAVLISSLCRTLKVCDNCLPFNEVLVENGQVDKECPGFTVFSCMLSILRVLLNLTHDNEVGSRLTGRQEGLIKTTLRCVLQVPQFVPTDQRFDLSVLSLGLLINMMEHCDGNRQVLVESKTTPYFEVDLINRSQDMPALDALTQLFVSRFECAQRLEEEQDQEREAARKREKERNGMPSIGHGEFDEVEPGEKSGEWRESESGLEWVVIPMEGNSDDESEELELLPSSQDEDENFTKALHKAGKHMEDSIVAAYVSLLVGCIVQNNSDLVEIVREGLPEGKFDGMILMLRKFLGFMNLTSSVGNTGGKSIMRVIEVLEAC